MKKIVVTESLFNAVKTLQKGGASAQEAWQYMGLSYETCRRIFNAETFEEYKNIVVAYRYGKKKKEEKKPELETKSEEPAKQNVNPTVVKLEATHYMMQELQKTNELLTVISAKLATIVSDLYGVKP